MSFSIGSAISSLKTHGKQTCDDAAAVSGSEGAAIVHIGSVGVVTVSLIIAIMSPL